MNKILEVKGLSKRFNRKKSFLKRKEPVIALNNVDLFIERGKTYGLVGESGSGKTTLGRIVLDLIKADAGQIFFDGEDLSALLEKDRKDVYRRIQMVFQDPKASLNPSENLYNILDEVLKVKTDLSKAERSGRIEEIVKKVGLSEYDYKKFPQEFSGGQAQRISIARALIVKPELVVLDEAVSALDISIQAEILNLILDMQKEDDLSYLFISHDLRVVRHMADKIGVLYMGTMMEEAEGDELFDNPLNPYSRMLIHSIPGEGLKEIPTDTAVVKVNQEGCPFEPRCELAGEICKSKRPELKNKDNRRVACHMVD